MGKVPKPHLKKHLFLLVCNGPILAVFAVILTFFFTSQVGFVVIKSQSPSSPQTADYGWSFAAAATSWARVSSQSMKVCCDGMSHLVAPEMLCPSHAPAVPLLCRPPWQLARAMRVGVRSLLRHCRGQTEGSSALLSPKSWK